MKYSISFILLSLTFLLHGQPEHPKPGEVFKDDFVPKAYVYIDPQFLEEILAAGNEESNEEFPATFIYETDNDIDTLDNIGFRLRGNTSRYAQKKSFKISINAFEQGRDYNRLEKINLNGEHNDPSIVRAKICWDLTRDVGAIASRANMVELFINDEYFGLYANVEHVDEEFVEERFGNKDGNLYKCLWPATLEYLGNDPNLYKFENGGRRAYELKTNEQLDDYTDLANFIDVLNNTPDDRFRLELERVFDVESYLRAHAVEILTGHWDNYSINKNNFYLYHNPTDDKFYFITYDLDNTLGIDWFGEFWADWNIYDWYSEDDPRPLIRRILEVPIYRDRFTQIMRDILENHFSPEVMYPRIDELKAQVQEAAERDMFRTYDYGFTIDDFNRSFDMALDPFHVRYGLKPWIFERWENAMNELEEPLIPTTGLDELEGVSVYPNPTADWLYIDKQADYALDIRLVSLAGKEIHIRPTGSGYDIRHIHTGVYMLIIQDINTGHKSILKIVKN